MSDVETLTYPLISPIDFGSAIEMNGANYTAYTLAPNSVHTCQTPKGGIRGILIDGGSGEYAELDGKEIKDSIVLLEFNSGNNWINVASLGAKSVIFLPPKDTNRFEAAVKTIEIPLNFPRLYIDNQTTALSLKTLALTQENEVIIHSNMRFASIEAVNIVGILPGSSTDQIIISSYFDSNSIVPSLSPGADESCGISTLLELIRIFNDYNITPEKTIVFLAFSGHNQAAAGAREFVYQNYDKLNVDSGIKLFLSLDFSASNNKIGINPYGYLYSFKLQFTTSNNLEGRLKDVGEDYLINYASEIRSQTGYTFEVKSFINKQRFEDIAPIIFVGDQEPFIASNVLGLSFFTMESYRMRYNTPFDIPSQLNIDLLKAQVIYSVCAITELVNEVNLDSILDLQHKEFSLKHTTHVGFGNVEGYCKEYNESTAWLSNVPNALIRVTTLNEATRQKGIYAYYTKTDETGHFQVRGVSSSQPDYPLNFIAEGYVFDAEGMLIKGINLGTHGKTFKNSNKLTNKNTFIYPTVFKCGTLSLFGVIHPYNQIEVADLLSYHILDPETRTLFFSYGYIGTKTVSLVFISPEKPSILVGKLPDGVLGIYITNSSSDNLRGNGLSVSYGEFRNIGLHAFQSSRDLQAMTQTYVNLYSSYNIYDSLVDDTSQRAANLIQAANTFYSNLEYSKAIVTIKQVQTWSYDAFQGSRRVIEDGTSTTIFFAILLLPFAFVMASLLFEFNSGAKKVVVTSGIYGLTLLFFYFIHPGLHLSSNIFMIIIGIIAIIFVFPALYMIYQEGFDFLRSLRVKLIGAHFADTSRTSTILIAMSTGISRMKKRKGRTIIALSGIVLITFSLTLFTSASTQVSVFARAENLSTPYNGVYLRTKDWTTPLSEQLLSTLEVQYGNESRISTRWWFYPPSQQANGFVNISTLSGDASWEGEAILGLTAIEPLFQPVLTALSSGNWFTNSSAHECILSDYSAEILGININDTVLWAGSEFNVVGVVDGLIFDGFRDFDNEALPPKNRRAPSPNVHIKTNQTFLLPSETARLFGASLYSISILAESDQALEIAETSSATYGRYLEIRSGFNGQVTIHKRVIQNLGQGLAEMGIPLAIAILLMINTSVSTVYESKKEIAIFTSLGLAPFHIAGLFLAEFLVYAVIGAVIGYLGGITSAVTLSLLGLFPESLAINYSSGSVINALMFGIFGILISTIYPLRISAKMSVPSVKRAWELETSPEEDGKTWIIPLPFVAATEEEAEGIIEFLREFFYIYESESVGGAFFAQEIQSRITTTPRVEKHLRAIVTLAPFDMGLKQKVDLYTYLDEINFRYVFIINLERMEGILSAWETSVRRFVDAIRKQLLIWRSLPQEEKIRKSTDFRKHITK
ncbi:MAG: M28 family peptidase [Candidatus Heimdallarchaeota archaeon]|nr:M28 family peptidase [Candidatus Heimdallarchaeota archaeon]